MTNIPLVVAVISVPVLVPSGAGDDHDYSYSIDGGIDDCFGEWEALVSNNVNTIYTYYSSLL